MNRSARVRQALLIASFLSLPVRVWCIAPDPGTEEQRADGKRIYDAKCSQCHDESGDGRGVGAEFFQPLPRDFTTGAYKIRTTGSGELPTDADMQSIIRRGMPGTGMPAWPDFSQDELRNLVYYIKTFYPDFQDSAYLVPPLKFGKVPAFSEESAQRGQTVFKENKCMDCHGAAGRGDGESGPTLEDDWGHRIRPADLTKRWTFRGGPTREDIYRDIMTGLNGTPMPSYASSIESEADRWALVDYVYSLSASDKAPYATVVVAEAVPEADLEKGRELFRDAKPALFPVVGQVIAGRRNFFPSIDAVEARAVYDSNQLAVLVTWHDMSAQREGSNAPMELPGVAAPETSDTDAASMGPSISDAMAVQMPLHPAEGNEKPHFLSGDVKRPVEIWFADLAGDKGRRFVGKGLDKLSDDGDFAFRSGYADGEWWVAFTRPRGVEKRLALEPGNFVPIAFSVWDGFKGETGTARGVTSWYSLYLKPSGEEHPAVPAGKSAAVVLGIELAVFAWLRKRWKRA